MILDLDTTLQPASYYRYARARDQVLFLTAPPTEGQPSREKFLRTSVPEDSYIYHGNYLTYLTTSWAQHYAVVLTPDIVWFAALNELAKALVAMPEPHRSLFTHSPAQITLKVMVGSPDEPLPLEVIVSQLSEMVPIDIQMFLPSFSTTTEMARLAMLASFAEACTPNYRYMTFMCGFPQIRIDGGVDDYDLIVGRGVAIYNEFDRINSPLVPWMTTTLMPWLSNIADAVHRRDATFFSKMVATKSCGSGGEVHVNGWWSRLFRDQPEDRKPENFPTQIARVPWENCETGRKFTLNCGVFHSTEADGFVNPQFAWVQNEITE
jgi:hypothetical protein